MRRGTSLIGYTARRVRRHRPPQHHWHQYEPVEPASSSPSLLPGARTVVVGLVVVLCVYVVYQLTAESWPLGDGRLLTTVARRIATVARHFTTVARRCPSDEFVAMLTRHSTPDRFVAQDHLVYIKLTRYRPTATKPYTALVLATSGEVYVYVTCSHLANASETDSFAGPSS